MIIGAHVSIAGGLSNAVTRAKDIGAATMQIFGSPPRSFKQPLHQDKEITDFRRLVEEAAINPVFFHGIYLLNLGTQKKELLEASITSLIHYLDLAEKLGVAGVIFHLGSHKGFGFEAVKVQISNALKTILEGSKSRKQLILESSVGQGGSIGSRFEELGYFVRSLASERVKICLDSQHLFAAGYPVHDPAGLEETLAKFNKLIGMENLVAFHLNDSKVPFLSGRDRHENIGEGYLGLSGIGNIINNPRLSKLPFILETPGFNGEGPDKQNIGIVESLVKSI